MQNNQKGRFSAKMRLGAYAMLVLLVVITLNTFVSGLVKRFTLTVDLTEGQMFGLTDTTLDILEGLESPVTITYFDEEKGADTNVSELLKQYKKHSSVIELRFLDPEANPGVVSGYEEEGLSVAANSVVVESGENAAAISWSDLYTYNTYTDGSGNTRYTMTAFKAEKKITSAIVQTTQSERPGVFFTQGHNENSGDQLEELVADSHYDVTHGVLGVKELAENVTTIVIAGPTRDFTEDEIALVDQFLDAGGSLVVYENPRAGELKNLDAFLLEWGLRIDGTIVMEPSRQMGSPINVIPDFAVHMINVYFSEASAYVVLPMSGSITLSNPNGRLTSAVLKSTSSSYGKYIEEADTTEKEAGDQSGPFVLAATSEQTVATAEGETRTSYVFLADCSSFYESQYLNNASLGNGQLVLQTLSYMNDNNVTLDIPEKSLGNSQIAVSWSSTLTIGIVFLAVIPVLLLLTGLIIFIKRRTA